MRFLHVLLTAAALVLASPPAWTAPPVRVATNADFGGAVLGTSFLYAGTSTAQGVELWRTDGTPGGTALVMDLLSGAASSYPGNFAVIGGVAYFTAYVSDTVIGLWKTDGTAAGTSLITQLPGTPSLMQAVGPHVYFNLIAPGDFSVWRSDGTAAGTLMLGSGFASLADEFTAALGKVFFWVDDGVHQEDVWVTDGTFEGTNLVKDINPGSDTGLVLGLRAAPSYLLFGALSDIDGLRLWKSDGTDAGTQPVGPIIYGEIGPVLNGAMLLTALDGGGYELWRSDGTPAGTFRLNDLLAGGSSFPRDFVEHLGMAYFTATIGTGGQASVFRADGTASGTRQMTAVISPLASAPRVVGGSGEEVFILVQHDSSRRAIWGADRELKIARKRFELTSPSELFTGFRAGPGGLYVSVYRGTGNSDELWFIAAESPAGDDDADGVPNGVEPGEGLNPLLKDNDVFTSGRLFAMQQYRDFLGREGDAGGITFHAQNINTGAATRSQVIENFLGSPEFQNGLPQCTRLYFSFFGRIPDYPGLLFQVTQYRSGVPLEAIAQNFANSPEFTSTYGSLTNDQYVNLVYQNVLGRAPDQAGYDYYFSRLESGALTRGQMMIGFSESPEFTQNTNDAVFVVAVYMGTLRRTPEPSGLDFYVDQLRNGGTRNQVITGFIGSPEYRSRFLP